MIEAMTERSEDVRARIEAACLRIEERLDREPSLEALAELAGFSPFHFHRLFRGLVGETVVAHRRRLLLERAAHRLEHGDEDLLAIALESGYASHEAFTRAFGKRFGVAPSDYRLQARGTARDAQPPPPELDGIPLRFERRPATTVACVRHVGPYSEVGTAWRRLMKWGWTKLVFGSPETFGLCHDDPDVTDPERVRYDACMVVAPGTRTRGDVRLRELPASRWAVTEHTGPYDGIGASYAALFARVATKEERWRLGDPPSLELYLNDPRKTRPSELRTEVWMPILPA